MIHLDRMDHIVLTVASIQRTGAFYRRVLGIAVERSPQGRTALSIGNQKINLHEVGHEFDPKAGTPMPGSADLCFVAATPLAEVMTHLKYSEIPIVAGPVERAGATGPMKSIYIRDPDNNLIELSNYCAPTL